MNAKKEYTFETVWKSIQELSEQIKETNKQVFSVSTEKDEAWRTEKDEIWKMVKENQKMIGDISKSNGEVAENTIYNALEQDMTFAGIVFDFIARNWKKHSKT